MPRKPPAEPIDHHYNISKLNRVFFVAGANLTATLILMVLAGDSRGWKGIQRTFLRLDRDKTLEAQQAAREKAYGAERDRLRQDLASAQREILEHGKTLAKLNRKLTDLDPKLYAADQNAKFLKASFDAARYKYEDDLANRPQSAPKSKRDL